MFLIPKSWHGLLRHRITCCILWYERLIFYPDKNGYPSVARSNCRLHAKADSHKSHEITPLFSDFMLLNDAFFDCRALNMGRSQPTSKYLCDFMAALGCFGAEDDFFDRLHFWSCYMGRNGNYFILNYDKITTCNVWLIINDIIYVLYIAIYFSGLHSAWKYIEKVIYGQCKKCVWVHCSGLSLDAWRGGTRYTNDSAGRYSATV